MMKGLLGDTRAAAAPALQAYNAMESTKRRHFDYLNLLESKRKKFNLQATSEESALLASLLEDHDDAVKNFKTCSLELKGSDSAAYQSLFEYIALLNEALSEAGQSNSH